MKLEWNIMVIWRGTILKPNCPKVKKPAKLVHISLGLLVIIWFQYYCECRFVQVFLHIILKPHLKIRIRQLCYQMSITNSNGRGVVTWIHFELKTNLFTTRNIIAVAMTSAGYLKKKKNPSMHFMSGLCQLDDGAGSLPHGGGQISNV